MIPPLLVITDRLNCVLPLEETVRAALNAGCRWIMMREKDLSTVEQIALATRLKSLCGEFDARLTVNGDRQAAEITGNLHIQDIDCMKTTHGNFSCIGLSAHCLDDINRAAAAGADYVTLSPIFRSISKPDYDKALGIEALADAASCSIPIVALGGITPTNAKSCHTAGAASIAVMGCIMHSREPGNVVNHLLNNLS